MANEYRLSDERLALTAPLIPTGRRGVKPSRNREVISGMLHGLKYGCRCRDCPEVFGRHAAPGEKAEQREARPCIFSGRVKKEWVIPPPLTPGSEAPDRRVSSKLLRVARNDYLVRPSLLLPAEDSTLSTPLTGDECATVLTAGKVWCSPSSPYSLSCVAPGPSSQH